MAAKLRLVLGLGAALLLLVVGPATAAHASDGPGDSSPSFDHKNWHGHEHSGSDPDGAVVSVEQSLYGPVLVVGGVGAGYYPADPTTNPPTPAGYNYPAESSLYFLSSDPPTGGHGSYQAACTTISYPNNGPCTSTPSDSSGEWPALTTNGPPVAGRGVNPSLLGTVYRADLGRFQVTYADHPLYLFDPGPSSFIGQHWFETVLPISPDMGLWSLMAPTGLPAPGVAQLEAETPLAGQTTYTSPVVGTQVFPNAGVLGPPFPMGGFTASVYAFSGDSRWQSRCVGACTLTWVPVLTIAPATVGSGLSTHDVGVIERPDGSRQVTYDGHPLYLYGQESVLFDASHNPISTGTAGNGNGVHAFGGTFTLVNP